MSKSDNHTPTPWQSKHAVIMADRSMVARCTVPNPMNTLANVEYANAAFIVRAVNSHAALVEALEATRTQLEYTGNGKPAQSEQWPGLYSQVLDALTLAKGA